MRSENFSLFKEGDTGKIEFLQLGEGKLLRTLIDPIIQHIVDNGWQITVTVTNLRDSGEHNIEMMKRQGGKYHIALRDDEQISVLNITCTKPLSLKEDWDAVVGIARSRNLFAIISNSTEAGFVNEMKMLDLNVRPTTFVGVLTLLLYVRYKAEINNKILILPTELLPQNGNLLRSFANKQRELWKLEQKFEEWLNNYVYFLNTLVDRIVVDVPDRQEYDQLKKLNDPFITVGESYGKWWIESSEDMFGGIPLYESPEVELVPDINSYYRMKVWLLNGPHLYLACWGLLHGYQTVFEVYSNERMKVHIYSYWEEIKGIVDLPAETVDRFITNTDKRFKQKWLEHKLSDIATNIPQKWRARIEEPLLLRNEKEGRYGKEGLLATATIMLYLSKKDKISTEEAMKRLTNNKDLIDQVFSLLDNGSPFLDFLLP